MTPAQKTGIHVPTDWARDVVAIAKPEVDDQGRREAVLEPAFDAFGEEIPEGQGGPFP